MFWVGTIYGRRDDGPRFEFFCHAALEYLRQTKQNPVNMRFAWAHYHHLSTITAFTY